MLLGIRTSPGKSQRRPGLCCLAHNCDMLWDTRCAPSCRACLLQVLLLNIVRGNHLSLMKTGELMTLSQVRGWAGEEQLHVPGLGSLFFEAGVSDTAAPLKTGGGEVGCLLRGGGRVGRE